MEKAQFVCWQKEAAVKDCVQSHRLSIPRNGFVFVYKRWTFQKTWYGGWWNAVFRQHDDDGFSLAIRDHLASAFLANWWRHVCCMRQLTRLWSCHIICATNMKNYFFSFDDIDISSGFKSIILSNAQWAWSPLFPTVCESSVMYGWQRKRTVEQLTYNHCKKPFRLENNVKT